MKDICIIGLGRVGLPLALSLEECGFDVTAVDINNIQLNNYIKNGEMPFYEPGYENLIKNSKIKVCSVDEYPLASTYIVTVGTPLKKHIESDLSYVKNVVENLFSKIDMNNKLLILRSTLSPGTTEYLKNWINTKTSYTVGENVFIAMCPERLAECFAYEELKKLPQIIGCEDEKSFELAYNVFNVFNVQIFKVKYIEAELSKLFTNIYRYINFSIPNYFTYLCSHYDANFKTIFDTMKIDYPRNDGLKSPGLVGGSCVKGERILKVYLNNEIKYINYKDFFELFNNSKDLYKIDSFNSDISNIEQKDVINVTKRKYNGKMYKFILKSGEIFECTENHLIPVKINNIILIKEAKDITIKDSLLEYA